MNQPEKLPVSEYGRHVYDIVYRWDFSGLESFFRTFNPEKNRKVCIVADSRVASLYMDAIFSMAEKCFSRAVSFVFPEGEESKNLDTVKDLYVRLIQESFDRKDLLVALGGGVTGDLCGFAAATYLRGIRFVQIPTSLLADVDSSIGGKTGVDFDAYKNMVGAFHMPSLVYINPSVLDTLDPRQFHAGMGEVVKSALIRDRDFFDWLENHTDRIEAKERDAVLHLIYCSNLVKKDVVEADPEETLGERAKLNFGHTLGHAIEKYMRFRFLHGECVSIGCILASRISVVKGLLSEEDFNRILKCFKSLSLPELPGDLNLDEVIKITRHDKKADGGHVRFILLKGIGNAVLRDDVTDEDMKAALQTYLKLYNKSGF